MILLDTHVLLWMACEPKRLSAKAREAIRNARQDSGVAVATCLGVGMVSRGKTEYRS